MNIADSLIDYLNSTDKTNKDLTYLIDSNIHTYNIDLDDIAAFSQELSSHIQQNFVESFNSMQEAFTAFTISTVGRPLTLGFCNPAIQLPLRHLRSDIRGDLISFRGIATRSSQVRPELYSAIFKCRDCGTKIGPIMQDHKYTEPLFCSNDICSNRTKYEIEVLESTFINWQRLNVQEDTAEMPEGSLPRTIEVILRNDLVESVVPGSLVKFTGYCMAVPVNSPVSMSKAAPVFEGVANEKTKRVAKDLNFKLVFFCIQTDAFVEEHEFTNTEQEVVRKIQSHENLYEKLYNSLFPTIYGHSNIKAAIMLMLVGGVSKNINGMKLRGDINLLLVGDPGTAKSQFLKHTAAILPRAVYTSGKSSTAAGLTAAVVKDGETGEFTIEAGALMLADNGVCCIDEFDKMSYKDQVSIHEAMEQQTITIAKAGINASLNSRTSILAAANPIRGRYDKKRNLRQNINLSAPIMSRFDLYFVLIDEIGEENDRKIASAILRNHRINHPSGNETTEFFGDAFSALPFTIDEVVLYIKYMKNKRPVLSNDASELLQRKYVDLRQDCLLKTSNYKMTARHLESMIRLSEALAKIHNDTSVDVAHIEEAYRLIQSSVVEVCGDDINLVCKEGQEDFVISNKDYLRIMNCLIYLLKLYKISREELTIKYLELIEENVGSVQQLEAERKRCDRTLVYLIEKEGVMYEIDNIVYIHPDYDN